MRISLWIAVAILFSVFSCTKIETTDIGSSLISPIDSVTTVDTTFEVITNNYINPTADSLKVNKYDDHVIGVINNDPLFGKTTAQAYFELKPTSYKFSFPFAESLNVDSAILILSYKGVYGDTTINQHWEVRELAESMKNDSIYSVSTQFLTGSILGTKSIDIPRLKDSVKYTFENANNQIRIKLDQTFANKLMKLYDSTDGNAYQNDSLFRLNFKGFAVGPAAGSSGNALISVNLLDSNTKLALFYNYKVPDSSQRDTAVSYFRFSEGNSLAIPVSGSANYIKREYNGSLLSVHSAVTDKNDSVVFIQTSPGTFATIKIPGLSGLQNSIIHRAELSVYQVPDVSLSDMIFGPPRYLMLYSYDSLNKDKINIPNDFVVNTSGANTSTFGGYLLQKEVARYGPVKGYVFDVSRYVQGIVTRKDRNLTLRLSAPTNDSLKYTAPYPETISSTYEVIPSNSNNVSNGRVILGGGGTKENPLRMTLRIIYSRI